MSVGLSSLNSSEVRRENRDEVHYRARVWGPDAKEHMLLVVNLSPHGLMARCDVCFEVGDVLRIHLPVVGVLVSEVRWSLGGRIGCQFEAAIDLASHYELIARKVRG